MPKRKTPEEKPEDQFKRFVETAKKAGVTPEEERRAEQAFAKLAGRKSRKA